VVNLTPQQLYTQENSALYALYRRLDGPQNQSGYYAKEKILLLCQESNPDSSVIQHDT
jgi:hypothetical protein